MTSSIPSLKLDSDLKKAVIRCTKDTFQTYFNVNVSPTETLPNFKAAGAQGWIVTSLAMRQKIDGSTMGVTATFMLCVSAQVLQRIVERYMQQVSVPLSVVDVAGELTNCIYGTLKAGLNELGFAFEMEIPVILAKNIADPEPYTHGSGNMLIPFSTENGDFYVCVSPPPG